MSSEAKILLLSKNNRDFYKRGFGCVIRSFESALRVSATEQEWDLRFGNLDRLINQFGIEEFNSSKRGAGYYSDIHSILGLVLELQTNPTPLGHALRDSRVLYTPGDGNYVHRNLDAGRRVLYAKPYHLAHIARLPNTRYLYTISDSEPRILSEDETKNRMDLFILTPKAA